jgi:hypothetical protein
MAVLRKKPYFSGNDAIVAKEGSVQAYKLSPFAIKSTSKNK